MALLTKDFLMGLKTHEDQLELLEEVFPQGAEITPESLAILQERGFDIGWLVAQKLPAELLESFAQNGDSWSRRGVAYNLHTPTHVLDYLAEHSDLDVHYWVVRNKNTSVRALMDLAKSPDPEVRLGVAQHPMSSIILLKTLTNDIDFSTRSCANGNLQQKLAKP